VQAAENAATRAAPAAEGAATQAVKKVRKVKAPPPPGSWDKLKGFAGTRAGKGILGGAALVGGGILAHDMMSRNRRQQVKTSAARTQEFFEKKAYLSTAERLFPEILGVKTAGIAAPAIGAASGGSAGTMARPTPSLKKAPDSGAFGAVPTNSPLSGGSA